VGGIHRRTDRQQIDLISFLLLFQNKEKRLKIFIYGSVLKLVGNLELFLQVGGQTSEFEIGTQDVS
jgi:hypothetical protein